MDSISTSLSTSLKTEKARKVCQDCQYSPQECAIFYPMKETYRSLITKPEQQAFFRGTILVAIFNYWTDNRTQPMSPKEMHIRTKVHYTLDQWHGRIILTVLETGKMDRQQLETLFYCARCEVQMKGEQIGCFEKGLCCSGE